MKRFLWALLGTGLSIGVAAQAQPAREESDRAAAPERASSDIRRFLTGENRVLITRRAPQPPVPVTGGSIAVYGVGAFEPGLESQRLLGLEIAVSGPDDSVATHFLDLHEIQSLLRAMAALRELEQHDARRFPTTARHVSREGFGVGLELDGEVASFLVLVGPAGEGRAALERADFLVLENRIRLALDRLFNSDE